MNRPAPIAVLTLLVWGILAAPLVMFTHPELVDVPSHLVRHELVARLPGDPVLDQMYTVQWRLLPNLAVDLWVWVLEPWLGVPVASRSALVVAMLGWVAAPVLLHRVLWGAWSVWPLGSGLVAYNAVLYMGFENFYVSVPLVLLVLTGWVATERSSRGPLHYGALALAALGVWVGHLVAWGVLVLCLAAWEMSRPEGRLGRGVWLALTLAPGAALFFGTQAAQPAEIGEATVWAGAAIQKLGVLLAPVLQYEPGVDLLHLVALLPALLVVPALFRRLDLHPRAGWVLAVLAAVSLAMPSVLMGIYYMDQRVPCVLLPLCFAATRVRVSRLLGGVLVAFVGLGLAMRVGHLVPRWAAHQARVEALHADVPGFLVPGDKVLVGGDVMVDQWHIADGLVPRARVFLPNLFTGAQLLDVTEAMAPFNHPAPEVAQGWVLRQAGPESGMFAPGEDSGGREYLRRWHQRFDVLLWLEPEVMPPLREHLWLVHDAGWYRVYRMRSTEGR